MPSQLKADKSISWLFWILWYASTALLLFVLPSFKHGVPIWAAADPQFFPILALVSAHLTVGIFYLINILVRREVRIIELILFSLSILGMVAIGLFITRSAFSRVLLPVFIIVAVTIQLAGYLLLKHGSQKIFKPVIGVTAIFSLCLFTLVLANPGFIVRTISDSLSSAILNIKIKGEGGSDSLVVERIPTT
jgi:hypothetical protein